MADVSVSFFIAGTFSGKILDFIQKYMSFNVIVATIEGNDYRINFWFMTKTKAVDRMKIVDLSE